MKQIKEYMKYNPETGEIFWLISPVSKKQMIGKKACCLNINGYIHIVFEKKCYKAHRLAWFLYHGDWPKNQIDHINGIKTDNRISNLRDVEGYVNQANKSAHRNGTLWGTTRHKKSNSYNSRFTFSGKTYSNGYFKTMEEAHKKSLIKFKEITDGCKICR